VPSAEPVPGRWVPGLHLPAANALIAAVGQGRRALASVQRGASWLERSLRQGVVVPLCVAGLAALGLAWFARPRDASVGAEAGVIERSVAPLAPAHRNEQSAEASRSSNPSRQGKTEMARAEPRWIEGNTTDFGAIERLLQPPAQTPAAERSAVAAHAASEHAGGGAGPHPKHKPSRLSAARAAPGARAHAARPNSRALPRSAAPDQH
jgi:hypothetical protein